jgi:hypothetical protein
MVLFVGGVSYRPSEIDGQTYYSSPGSSDLVDIYDARADVWSTASLPRVMAWSAALAVGDRVFFFGSGSGAVHIFELRSRPDASSPGWS